MATNNKLMFPVGFDFSEAMTNAEKDAVKLLRKLKNRIEHPTPPPTVPIKADVRQLRIELRAEMQRIKREWNNMNLSQRFYTTGDKAGTLKPQAQKLLQEYKAVEVAMRNYGANINSISSKLETSARRQTSTLATETRKQSSLVGRLMKRMAVYASFGAIMGYLKNIREVTAQFELQRVALGAIIQDQMRANQLFGEIKAFAIKSPLSIMQLTRYTKQVAAYRIETDKLFDTTKRLADVSVGLGVDMGRLVLAYGQVKAATYLRAAEVRQFTEAGIPMLELLAEKFTQLEGSIVSTEMVMDRIKKRMVTFAMVEQVFKDMTDAGGMFYNMQEKQGNTLFGMWAKLGDAASMMYDEIGNTYIVNNAMKGFIQLLMDLMKHWTALANVVSTVAIGFGTYKMAMAGLIPPYNLKQKMVMQDIKAEKLHQRWILNRTSLFATLNKGQVASLKMTQALTTAEWKEYINKNKLNSATAVRLARLAKNDAALKKALISTNLYTKAQLAQIQALSKGAYAWRLLRSSLFKVGEAFVRLGQTLKTLWPLFAITSVVELITGYKSALHAQSEAVKDVQKLYDENKVKLMRIRNAYEDIKRATKSATQSEEDFLKTSYSQKFEQLQKVVKILNSMGMRDVIDLSTIDYTNIDETMDEWLGKLEGANELTLSWGKAVASTMNAYEANVLGWSLAGENLSEDIKDWERAWTKLTTNKDFNKGLDELRVIVDDLANTDDALYQRLSQAIGVDAKLAIQQRRRNESELEYQRRIYKKYQDIAAFLEYVKGNFEYSGWLPSYSASDSVDAWADYQAELDEVMHEFEKTKEEFRNQPAVEVKMAIDTMAAKNQWSDWQKRELIDWLNKEPITLNAELIPQDGDAKQGKAWEGVKSIISSEFPNLFSNEELESIVSVEQMYEKIAQKLKGAQDSLQGLINLQNNLVYGSTAYEQSLATVKELQDEIAKIEAKQARVAELQDKDDKTQLELQELANLQAELQDTDNKRLETMRAQVAEIVNQNEAYERQIKNQKEQAEDGIEVAASALERISNLGLSTLGKDVKEQFQGLMVDVTKSLTDLDYSTDFLVSDDDLAKIRDVADLYELWAKNTKSITEEKQKLQGTGISEATIAKERADLDAKQLKLQEEYDALEQQIAASKEKELYATYVNLTNEIKSAKNSIQRNAAEQKLNKFLKDNASSQLASLLLKKQGLQIALSENLLAQKANEQLKTYVDNLGDLGKLWEDLGKRYNFTLFDKSGSEDPWILLMKNRMKFMQDFQKGVSDFGKYMTNGLALPKEQGIMDGRGASLGINVFSLDGTKKELLRWYGITIKEIQEKIAKLGGKQWAGLGVQAILAKDTKSRIIKKYQELLADVFKEMTDFETEQMQKAIENKLKKLAEDVARSKAAKSFFDNIFSQSKDYDMSMALTLSIYGDAGEKYRQQIINQIRGAFGAGEDWEIDVSTAINVNTGAVNYNELERIMNESLKDENLQKYAEQMRKVIEEGRKFGEQQAKQWVKDLTEARSYAEKRIDLAKYTAERIREIENDPTLSGEAKGKLRQQYQAREKKEADKLQYEAFKNSPMYVQMFENLENATSASLEIMRNKLIALQSSLNNLDPAQLKEIQKRLEEVESQLSDRNWNPFGQLRSAWKDFDEWSIKLKDATKANGAFDLSKYGFKDGVKDIKQLNNAIATLSEKQMSVNTQIQDVFSHTAYQGAVAKLNELQAQYDTLTDEQRSGLEGAELQQQIIAAQNDVAPYDEKLQRLTAESDLYQKILNYLTGEVSAYNRIRAKQKQAWKGADMVADGVRDCADAAYEMAEAFGANAESLALFSDIKDAVSAVYDTVKTTSDGIAVLSSLATEQIETVEAASMILAIISAAVKVATAIYNVFANANARYKERAIEREQQLIESLKKTYDKLSDAMDKVFGSAYIANYNQRIENLKAQEEAARKKAELEKEKGKKKDEDKIKEYKQEAEDVADELVKMQTEVAERMAGTDVASAARDFASAWLDAYISFGNTSQAIKEKFNEMVKNMIIESSMAQIAQSILQPFYDEIATKAKSNGGMDENEIKELVDKIPAITNNVSDGLQIFANQLEALGMDLHQLGDTGEFSGIARDIASASEESITGLAAMINTQNYYISNVPLIYQEVVLIRQLLSGEGTAAARQRSMEIVDVQTLQNQYLSELPNISTHTAAIAERCERAVQVCEEISDNISRVVKPRGFAGDYAVNIN